MCICSPIFSHHLFSAFYNFLHQQFPHFLLKIINKQRKRDVFSLNKNNFYRNHCTLILSFTEHKTFIFLLLFQHISTCHQRRIFYSRLSQHKKKLFKCERKKMKKKKHKNGGKYQNWMPSLFALFSLCRNGIGMIGKKKKKVTSRK